MSLSCFVGYGLDWCRESHCFRGAVFSLVAFFRFGRIFVGRLAVDNIVWVRLVLGRVVGRVVGRVT